MYLLNVNAIVPEDKIATVKPAHGDWVKQGFEKGWFLFAGPKSGKSGGVILVKSIAESELQEFIALDPYVIEKVAEYEVINFNVALAANGLENLKN